MCEEDQKELGGGFWEHWDHSTPEGTRCYSQKASSTDCTSQQEKNLLWKISVEGRPWTEGHGSRHQEMFGSQGG